MIAKKMAALSSVFLLLLVLRSIVNSAATKDICNYYAAPKQDVVLLLNHVLKKSDQWVRWMHKNRVIFDQRQNFRLSGNDIYQNGSLKLKNVNETNVGEYRPFVYDDGQEIGKLSPIYLCMMDPVPQPQMINECGKDSVKFICKLNQTKEDINFEWLENEMVVVTAKTQSFEKPLNKVENSLFKCRVFNKVSSLTSISVHHNCIKTDNRFFFSVEGNNIWIIVGTGGGVVLLLIIIVIICCVKNKRKKRMHIKEEEELRLGWSNSNPQCQYHQQPHQHPYHQQKPAGHTGPRQHQSKQPHGQQRPQAPKRQPQPGTGRAAQGPRQPDNDAKQHPPLPQPRRKVPKKTANMT